MPRPGVSCQEVGSGRAVSELGEVFGMGQQPGGAPGQGSAHGRAGLSHLGPRGFCEMFTSGLRFSQVFKNVKIILSPVAI